MLVNGGENAVLRRVEIRLVKEWLAIEWSLFTLLRAAAISKVPTVSMLAAIIGTPVQVCSEFKNFTFRCRSTCVERGEEDGLELFGK